MVTRVGVLTARLLLLQQPFPPRPRRLRPAAIGPAGPIHEQITNTGLLLLVDLGVQADKVRRRLDGQVGDCEIEQTVERRGMWSLLWA